jgi:hypothetical protein
MDIFKLAEMELKREGNLNKPNEMLLLIDRAFKIRTWLDCQEKNQKVSRNRYRKKGAKENE